MKNSKFKHRLSKTAIAIICLLTIYSCEKNKNEEVYFAGGCLWGVQEFFRHLPGVVYTEAGRANGKTDSLGGDYDGYAECVKVRFDPSITNLDKLIDEFFDIIDPYSLNKQGIDEGPKYRTGIYSKDEKHLKTAQDYIQNREDREKIMIEVKPLIRFVRSAEEHQDRLQKHPDDYCHIPKELLNRYKD